MQHGHAKRILASLPSSWKMVWRGIKNPRHFRGEVVDISLLGKPAPETPVCVLDAALLPGRTTPSGGACSIRAMTVYGTQRKILDARICDRCRLSSRHRRRAADPALVCGRCHPRESGDLGVSGHEVPAPAGMTEGPEANSLCIHAISESPNEPIRLEIVHSLTNRFPQARRRKSGRNCGATPSKAQIALVCSIRKRGWKQWNSAPSCLA